MSKKLKKPITIDYTKNVIFQFIMSQKYLTDELTIVLKCHLFTEYILDQIIVKKLKRRSKILEYKFSQKVEILYSADLIPSYLYKNISYLNKIRNKFAHNLGYDISQEKLELIEMDGKKADIRRMLKKKSSRQQVRTFCVGILHQLNCHLASELGIPPIFK